MLSLFISCFQNMYSFKTSMASVSQLVQTAAFKNFCKKTNIKDANLAPRDIVPTQLLDKSNQAALFPEDTIIVLWENYNMHPSNFQYIMETSTCHMTFSDSTKVKVSAVSFISEIRCDAGLRCYVTTH